LHRIAGYALDMDSSLKTTQSNPVKTQMQRRESGIQVLSRAADILRALSQVTDGLSLGQIARKVDLPRSTVQRIVSALSAEGFVSSGEGDGGIRLGPELQALATASVRDPKVELRALMRRIADETGETVDLAILDGDKMLFIDQIVGPQRLRTVSSIGETFPLTMTANGKAALACLKEPDAARLIISEVEHRGGASTTLATLLSEIQTIRDGALATDEDSHTDGVSAVGFALRDAAGDVYAISVPVPSSRYAQIKDELGTVLTKYRETKFFGDLHSARGR
jgi:DNA-binding IclR family transcriptional regulator